MLVHHCIEFFSFGAPSQRWDGYTKLVSGSEKIRPINTLDEAEKVALKLSMMPDCEKVIVRQISAECSFDDFILRPDQFIKENSGEKKPYGFFVKA